MSRSFPEIVPLRQHFHDQPEVANVALEVEHAILTSHLVGRVPSGGRIAVTVGSRGIAGIAGIVRSTVSTLSHLGFRPFVVAAMGSHGKAEAAGQREILAGYGITEQSTGVEIRTDMDTLELGKSPIGLPIYFDRNAYQADGIVLVNRVKPHTDFRAPHESGILKMLVIGLGKRKGAEQIHRLGLRGMTEVLPAVGRFLVENTPFALGLAIVENADDWPAEIAAVEPDTIFDLEPALLEKARQLMGRLPFDQIDALVVGELGKNYSGAGLDPNVIGRLMIETQPDFDRPRITRIAVLDASEESHGNIVGTGFADLVSKRLVDRLDPAPFQINVLTSCFLERARIPITLPTDQEVIAAALDTCWRTSPADARLVIIPNTLELKTLWVSPALQPDLDQLADSLRRDTDYLPIPFDAAGRLLQEQLFPDCIRAHRSTRSAALS